MSADYCAIMYFDLASLVLGLLAGALVTLCVWVLWSIWGRR